MNKEIKGASAVMNRILAFINTIIGKYPEQEKLLLVSSMTRGCQILESLSLDLVSGCTLRPVTPFDLALEILKQDIDERRLKVISDKQVFEVLRQIVSSHYDDKMRAKNSADLAILFEKIIQLRLNGEENNHGSGNREIGWILNEYDLTLEAGGFLDEAAVFEKAAGIMESNSSIHEQKIFIIPEPLMLSPIAHRFVDAVKAEEAYK